MEHATANPAFTIGIALAAGVVAQGLARHLRVPGIVLLLATGVLLGPEGIGLVRPDSLGSGLQALIGFAVAIILFEGGLNLELRRLRAEGQVVRRLLTVGALITMLGGAVAARIFLGWDWRLAILFGALVIVTGPTVVTPLLRRVPVSRSVQTVLEAEGVLIDAVGAITAVVALEVLVQPASLASTAEGVSHFALRFALGVPLGALGGLAIARALRFRRLVPDGLENIFTLALVLALYQVADALMEETGIVTVTVAGLIVGNMNTRVSKELSEFKEQLTVLFIGLLFVLLAAAVEIDDVRALGLPGLAVVATLMLVVRPVQAAVCTFGSELSFKERAFIGWVAPRGIVAAAVASLFATSLNRAGIDGGNELSALVFLVIAATVVAQGISMGAVAGMLGVGRPGRSGYVVLGANGLALAVATALRDAGAEPVVIESNPDRANQARAAGFQVIFGNGLSELVALRARPERRLGALALTPNEEANLLFARRMVDEYDCPQAWVALDRVSGHLSEEVLREAEVGILFRHSRDLTIWALWLERGRARVTQWHKSTAGEDPMPVSSTVDTGLPAQQPARKPVLPLVVRRAGTAALVDDTTVFEVGDLVWFAIDTSRGDAAVTLLQSRGWSAAGDEAAAASEDA
jgi:NhaP-type Na+/H+ or K+/H+ antiporter